MYRMPLNRAIFVFFLALLLPFFSHAQTPSGFDLGVEGGMPVRLAGEALQKLEQDSPADLEILLAYSIDEADRRFNPGSDFGHMAVRIGEKVFTFNHLARPSFESSLFPDQNLEEYLYGINRRYKNAEHASAWGLSYGRDNISLRVKGISRQSVEAMLTEVSQIEDEWRAGKFVWSDRKNNCADVVVRILEAGFLIPTRADGRRHIVSMPLDVFDRYLHYFARQHDLRIELVAYKRIPDSKNKYQYSRFPVSLFQPGRALRRILTVFPDRLISLITKTVTAFPGDDRLYYRNLSARTDGESCAWLAEAIGSVSHGR